MVQVNRNNNNNAYSLNAFVDHTVYDIRNIETCKKFIRIYLGQKCQEGRSQMLQRKTVFYFLLYLWM